MQTLVRDKNGRFTSKKSKSKSTSAKVVASKKQLKNHVIIILDESGSMSGLARKVQGVSNNILDELEANAQKFNQRTEVTFYTFSEGVRKLYEGKNIKVADRISYRNYSPAGGTALFDAVGEAIETAQKTADYDDQDTSFHVLVITDGAENSSKRYVDKVKPYGQSWRAPTFSRITDLLSEVDKTERWTVTFQLPPNAKNSFVSQFNIPYDNVIEWEASEKGLEDVARNTSGGFTNYYNSRSLGETKTCSFFSPDLSQVSKNIDILDDLSKQYDIEYVNKDKPIKKFVEDKNITFIKGAIFYQLTKPELVQSNKQVLIRDRSKNEIYGGRQARNLIGMPDKNVKVNPVSHPKYDIFCQSTSVNRQLKTGQFVLIKK